MNKALISQCRNMSSEDAPAGGFARVVGKEWRGDVAVLKIDKPDSTLATEYVVIGRSKIPSMRWGDCVRFGPVRFRWNTSGTAPTHGAAFGPKPNEWVGNWGYPSGLISNGLSISSGLAEGFLWPYETAIGKLAGALAVGDSATVAIWGKAAGAEFDTLISVTARDWLMKTGATSIASGKKVVLKKIGGVWYVVEAECA